MSGLGGAVRNAARAQGPNLQHRLGNQAVQHLAQGPLETVLRAPGQRLPNSVREAMNARFGQDFSAVRVHAGPDAAASADTMAAKAFTLGADIVFGAGEYAPETVGGLELLAHELAHVVQQGRGGPVAAGGFDHSLEASARQAAAAVARGSGPVEVSGASAVGVARQERGPLFQGGTKLYPRTVKFKNAEEYDSAALTRNLGPPNHDIVGSAVLETITTTEWLPYPEVTIAAPKPDTPPPKPSPKPAKAPPRQDPPVSAEALRDIADALAPKLIFPKPVRQFFGGLQFVGGSLEAGLGGVGGLATAETGAGLVAGAFLLGHGVDVAGSGWTTMWTGEESKTYTFMTGAGWAYTLGADPKLANAIGQSTDLIANIGSAGLTLGTVVAPIEIVEEAPSYKLLFYHGRVFGRDVVTVETPSGPRAFYARTGGGGANVGGAQPGDWAPFEGFSSEGGVFPYRGNLVRASEGWFVKHRFAIGLEEGDPLYRFGTEQNLDISKWLGRQSIPTGGPPYPWRTVQSELSFFGVPTIDPIPYYGRVPLAF